jgi:hypothetical protein
MLRMRRGDIDHIHAIVGHDLLIRPVRLRQAVLRREGLCSLGGTTGDSHRLRVRDVREVLDHQGRNPARPDDPPANSL